MLQRGWMHYLMNYLSKWLASYQQKKQRTTQLSVAMPRRFCPHILTSWLPKLPYRGIPTRCKYRRWANTSQRWVSREIRNEGKRDDLHNNNRPLFKNAKVKNDTDASSFSREWGLKRTKTMPEAWYRVGSEPEREQFLSYQSLLRSVKLKWFADRHNIKAWFSFPLASLAKCFFS